MIIDVQPINPPITDHPMLEGKNYTAYLCKTCGKPWQLHKDLIRYAPFNRFFAAAEEGAR